MDRGHGTTGARRLALAATVWAVHAAAASAATLTVTTTFDPSGALQCSLREAIATVNSPGTPTVCGTATGVNTIVLGPNPYQLMIPLSGAENNASGALDVTSAAPLTINGAGDGSTTIAAATGLLDRVLTVNAGANVTLSGLTLTGGRAPDGSDGADSTAQCSGGGDGGAGADGGGILNRGSLTLDGVDVAGNDAGNGGNGESLPPPPGTNGCAGGDGGSGGGIFNSGALTLMQSTVSGNAAGNGGHGGDGVTFGGQSGGNGGQGGCCGDGGGIENGGGTVTVMDSTISFNDAGNGGDGGSAGGTGNSNPPTDVPGTGGTGAGGASGGGISTSGGTVSVLNSTIAFNRTGTGGNGGLGGPAQMTGDGGSGGGAGFGSAGGAIFDHNSASVSLLQATVADNQVGGPGTPGAGGAGGTGGSNGPTGAAGNPAFGGGVYVTGASATIDNTLLASNQLGNCALGAGGALGTADDLSFGDSTCTGSLVPGDPKLGNLQDNGGPTETMGLGPGSAAIDKGLAGDCPMTDQRGVPRPGGAACDIGAYEVAAPAAITGAATALAASGATLNAIVTPNQATGSAFFEYGTTTAYGSQTAPQTIGGVQPVPVAAPLTGLQPGTTYHYRVVASSSDGQSDGADATLTTPAASQSTGSGSSPPAKPGKPALHHAINHRLRSAKFTFGGGGATGFQCALVKSKAGKKSKARPRYSACRSPKSYKGLAHGSYEFFVRGRDAAGTGPTAAFKFTI